MQGQLNTKAQVENAAFRIALSQAKTCKLRWILKGRKQADRKLRCFAYAELLRRQRRAA